MFSNHIHLHFKLQNLPATRRLLSIVDLWRPSHLLREHFVYANSINHSGENSFSKPSQLPSVIRSPASVAPTTMMSLCPSFSVTNTNSATINYATCSFTACPGDTVVMSTFSPGSCNGDTYLRLFDPSTGDQLTENDDYDGSLCSQITYSFTSSCRAYTVAQGCYQSLTCGGQVTYSGIPGDQEENHY